MRNSRITLGNSLLKWSIFLITVMVFLFPYLFLIIHSFAFSWQWPDLLPKSLSLRAWGILIQDPQLLTSIIVTLTIGAAVVVMNLILAFPAAKALSHYQFKGKTLIEAVLFMPILIPALAVAMGLHLTMIRLGLANTWWGVVLVHLIPTLPYSIRILRSGFDRMGIQWEEQARSLGIYSWQNFWSISVPFLLPSIRSVIILSFVISLSQYVLTLIIGGGLVVTLPMIYYPFLTSVDQAVMASFSLLFAAMPIVFLAVTEGVIRFLLPGRQRMIKGG